MFTKKTQGFSSNLFVFSRKFSFSLSSIWCSWKLPDLPCFIFFVAVRLLCVWEKELPEKKHVGNALPFGGNKSLGFKSETVCDDDTDVMLMGRRRRSL